MNQRDATSLLNYVEALVAKNKRVAVIAFDIKHASLVLRNTRRGQRDLLEELNDLLSGVDVCRSLGGIFTVCEYEGRVCYLIRAECAISETPLFNPQLKSPSTNFGQDAAE